jgi:tetratricopeptide (TPR) repeat protein
LFRFAKSNLYLNTKRYDECIAICDKLLEEPDPIADAYYNIGLAYFNKAIEIEKLMMGNTYTRSKRRSFQEQKEKLYRQSLGYLETFRSIAPEKQKQWAVPLYTIYLNLNMGKEFEEIEKMRR